MTYMESKLTNTTQAGFHGPNMAIIIQDNITESLDNLTMATTGENMCSHSLTEPSNIW